MLQPIPESVTGLAEPEPTTASVAPDRSADVARLVGSSLDSHSGQAAALVERVSDLARELTRMVGGVLSVLLNGHAAPNPDHNGVARLLAFYSGQTTGLIEQANVLVGELAQAVGELAQAVGGLLGREGAPNPINEPISSPAAPTPAAPTPAAPAPVAPAFPGGSSPLTGSSLSNSLTSSGYDFGLSFCVLASFTIVLLQGGKFSWARRQPLKPNSALRLAVERPG